MSEPIFRAVSEHDPIVLNAHRGAAQTLGEFRNLMQQFPEASFLAKLRFRDPDLSDLRGEDARLYLWLSEVVFHEEAQLFSGEFFEVPKGFEKWHAVGSRLAFEAEDIFDWMVNHSGHIFGGFTIRLHRDCLSADEQIEYDSYMGVKAYEPMEG